MSEDKSLPFLSVEEIAEESQTSTKTIYKMIEAGQIPSVRFGRLLRVPRAGWERIKNGQVAA